MLSYPLQYIRKCRSSSIWFSLHTKHFRSSTGIDAPVFSYLMDTAGRYFMCVGKILIVAKRVMYLRFIGCLQCFYLQFSNRLHCFVFIENITSTSKQHEIMNL